MVDKVIVTNRSALAARYQAAGTAKVEAAVTRLITADAGRGIETILVALDDAPAMSRLNAPVVADSASASQNKHAIDAVWKKVAPDYLMILGAPDVVPHVPLKNPIEPAQGEIEDPHVDSDLPYACDAGHSLSADRFLAPARVVGRLPDVAGATNPAGLVKLLDLASKWKSRDDDDYRRFFGLTAHAWKASTELSLKSTFGSHSGVITSPPKNGGAFTKAQLAPLSHFINCHGAVADPSFYGDPGAPLPMSHAASQLAGKISPGTIVSAECCYGAELYDERLADHPGICNAYLSEGAYGFFGSSTIAYGLGEGNACADLICQYFLQRVLAGSSLGRATLEARIEFVQNVGDLDPINLKTLIQFNLMGDPSIHPVDPTLVNQVLGVQIGDGRIGRKGAGPKAIPKGRQSRRLMLLERAAAVAKASIYAKLDESLRPTPGVRAALDDLAKKLGLGRSVVRTYKAHGSRAALASFVSAVSDTLRKNAGAAVNRYHLLFPLEDDLGAEDETGPRAGRVVVAREVKGKLVGYVEYQRHGHRKSRCSSSTRPDGSSFARSLPARRASATRSASRRPTAT